MAGTSKEIFEELRQDIDDYADKWEGYFFGMSEAYATAYKSQEDLLRKIKGAIEARKKQEEENRVFALSMVTAGFAGLFATHFSKEFKKKAIADFPDIAKAAGGDEIINDMVSRVGKAVSTGKDAIKGAGKQPMDELLEFVGIKSPAVSEDGFVPSGVTPAEYGAQLQQGAKERKNVLADVVRLFSKNADSFQPEIAKIIADNTWESPFFTEAPPSVMSQETKTTLVFRAKLALWVVWALERDKDYWQTQCALRLYNFSEVFDWEPLRLELNQLGVPLAAISFKEYYSPRDYTPGAMNVEAYIKWAESSDSLRMVFSGLDWTDEGMTWVQERWKKKFAKGA